MIESFVEKVERRLSDKGMTNYSLAKKLEISPSYLSEILNDKKLAIEQRVKIAEYLEFKLEIADVRKPLNIKVKEVAR
ncbi:helix-turn-helix domain-containing protein [Carnobacterium maltaromaticum]|uniref:helix-turn-helix domain-containing protein n=1 Tax=Carnobacterium maltaromaticum TaxID=2751 RepID=UPI00295E8C25|nr:helix-turn-helix domain-containing protein [Carnobacterium maltaromaticum]